MNKKPEEAWTLEGMAHDAAISRSEFLEVFGDTVGQAPNGFLTDLRLSMA